MRAGKIAATLARLQAGGGRQASTRCRQEATEAPSGRPDARDGVFAPLTGAKLQGAQKVSFPWEQQRNTTY